MWERVNLFPHLDAFSRICINEQFLLLPLCFQCFWIIIFSLIDIDNFCLDQFINGNCRFVECGKGVLNPFPLADTFWHIFSRQLLKTLWQTKKLLMMSNFSFCRTIFWFINEPFIYSAFPYVCLPRCLVVSCRFVCMKSKYNG